jgi:hypothetical protein
MRTERRDSELWRERHWRCERWSVGGQPQVRLYLRGHLMSELAAGPKLDLERQTDEWLKAARADKHRT